VGLLLLLFLGSQAHTCIASIGDIVLALQLALLSLLMTGWPLLKLVLALEIIYYGKLAILKYVKNKPPAILLMAYQLQQICS
jgi:hypothetical protein